jgi:hypothetical protein
MNARSQQKAILEILNSGGSLTKWDALHDLHIGNLGARIGELREQKYQIETVMEPNADGVGKHARYYLPSARLRAIQATEPFKKVESKQQSLI